MKPIAVLKFGDAIGGKFKFCDDNQRFVKQENIYIYNTCASWLNLEKLEKSSAAINKRNQG